MSELVVDFVRIGNGLGNCLADGLTPLLAEAMELGAQGGQLGGFEVHEARLRMRQHPELALIPSWFVASPMCPPPQHC